jgi:predicted NUDIX family NTP pyrophosphohydrolase
LRKPSGACERIHCAERGVWVDELAAAAIECAYDPAMKVDKTGRISAGIVLWRRGEQGLEVLLAHMGGPSWAQKDHGHWTVPKGEIEPGEELEAVARREFHEETGRSLPDGLLVPLGQIRQKSGKVVHAWGVEGDLDPALAVSNTYEVEWPPKSGRMQSFPEIDRVEWFDLVEARTRLKAAQVPFIDRLVDALAQSS